MPVGVLLFKMHQVCDIAVFAMPQLMLDKL
jgi:hypothetical protein